MRVRLFVRLILLLAAAPAAKSDAQITGPYLQSPTDTSVWITWKTSTGTESKVAYSTDSLSLSNVVTGTCQPLSDMGYEGNYFYHSVQLTGLEPDHYYFYRAITGSQKSALFRFRSQIQPGTSGGIYRFLIFGDHQVRSDDRYQRLLTAAREKVTEKYGGRLEDHIRLIINDGDQVDEGTLDQYENIHLKPSSLLSGNVPFMTTVGNHETYGSIGLPLYYAHYFYDSLSYKGIISPGGENYYAYRQNNIVFIHLSSEHPESAQTEWIQQIIDSVKTDVSIDWVISVAHRPIQAEQYVGDISTYIRDQIVPVLGQTVKSVLLITGHHHLYARGQVRDFPIYHIISGGGSWDQYWGQSTEKDFDDVQKTIDYWTYQIVSIDGAKKELSVESYAIGSPKLGFTLDNVLIDSFYRKAGQMAPDRPAILTIPSDSISLPYAFVSSAYATGGGELYNSVQFQVSASGDFSKSRIDLIRDFENLYGTTGHPDYKPVDIHKDVDIFRYEIGSNQLANGDYFIRVRHRDRNMEWSTWSEPVAFIIKGSTGGELAIATPNNVYEPNDSIAVEYVFGTGSEKDWIGIYKSGDIPGTVPSTDWNYVNGTSGTIYLQVSEPGSYFISYFLDDGYSEPIDRLPVFIINAPEISLNKAGFEAGEEIRVSFSQAPGLPADWIGIYHISDIPGVTGSTRWAYTSGNQGQLIFEGLPAGYYFAAYFLQDGYTEASDRNIFSVGSDLAIVSVDQDIYAPGQPVNIVFNNGPGAADDWIGIMRENALPGIAPLITRKFIHHQPSGSLSFDVALDPGEYYASLFINNSNVRVSNKAAFVVESGTALDFPPDNQSFSLYPSSTGGRFTIKSINAVTELLRVKILSMSGTLVLNEQYPLSTSVSTTEFDLSSVPRGVYIVSLSTANTICLKKLILQ